MQHCCKFNPIETYYLKDSENYSSRTLAFGYCPICSKPVAELREWSYDGILSTIKCAGNKVNNFINRFSEEIEYSSNSINKLRFKSRPFGWKFGVNKVFKQNGKVVIKQFAKDFYGNTELIKIIK